MENIIGSNVDIILKLVVAMTLGMIIGAERIFHHKTAGMRTYALVSMGAALFIIISEMIVKKYAGLTGFNPAMIPSTIITAVGFLVAGAIIFQGNKLIGLTTAGGLWVAAGIGIASGFGFFSLAVIATLLTFFIFTILYFLEAPIKKFSGDGKTVGDDM